MPDAPAKLLTQCDHLLHGVCLGASQSQCLADRRVVLQASNGHPCSVLGAAFGLLLRLKMSGVEARRWIARGGGQD